MTINEAIGFIDDQKPNTFSRETKIRWLSQLDMEIWNNIITKHVMPKPQPVPLPDTPIDTDMFHPEIGEITEVTEPTFDGYDSNTDGEHPLFAPQPYDEMYIHWLESKIDYYNGEYGHYNNTNAMFQNAFREYQNWYNREHEPLNTVIRYF